MMLKDFSPRPYQLSIFQTSSNHNTLIVLPTGLGKTAIAMLVAAKRKLLYPDKKILFLAPTKPLVEQQLDAFKNSFETDDSSFALFTGSVSPKKRHELWNSSLFIFSTPQTIENDVLSGKISLEDVSLLVVDEAHRCVGDYAYVFLAKKYEEQARHFRIIALSASPGTDEEKIHEVMNNLFIERIEYRTPDDPQVKKYTQHTDVSWEYVQLDDILQRIHSLLTQAYISKIKQINEIKDEPIDPKKASKTFLLKLQHRLHARVTQGDVTSEVLQAISLLAQALKIQHALELLETQSLHSLYEYMHSILEKSRSTRTKAIKNLVKDPYFLQALALVRQCKKEKKEHPKMQKLVDKVALILHKNKDSKFIIFTQFRDTAQKIHEILSQLTSTAIFFGQAKKNGVGFSQKQQKETLEKFRNAEFSCLIATSVAEEGLDIPSVDHVFFYEPIPSAIRSVQRRGRTGRHSKGFVTVFVTKGTRDEANRWVAFHKEKRMYAVLNNFSKKLPSANDTFSSGQQMLQSFSQQTQSTEKKKQTKEHLPKIIVDHREKGSPTLKALLQQSVDIELKQLDVGDFIVSKDCAVEFKNIKDFVDSIVDGRILVQLRSLAQYKKPILILEGDQEQLHALRKVDESAIHGMIATISTSYRIPIIRTFTPFESAKILAVLAKREQIEKDEHFTYHTAKPLVDKDLLEYIVSSLPQVGGSLAKSLLSHFDSIQSLVHASVDDLKKIPLIGEKKAQEIKRVLSLSYKEAQEKLQNI